MKLRPFLILLMMLFLCSCRQNKQITTIGVNVDTDQAMALSNRISISKIIALDEALPVGEVRKVVTWDDRYWVLNKSNEEILCYDAEGKLLFNINRNGRGPEEYLFINNFYIDPYDSTLKILAGAGKIVSYSLEDGAFVSSVQTDYLFVNDGIAVNEQTTLWSIPGGEANSNLAVMNKQGENRYYFPFNEVSDFTLTTKAFARSNEDVLFAYGMCDSIYSIGAVGISPRYGVDFGRYGVDPNIYGSLEQMDRAFDTQIVAGKIDNLNVTERLLTFSYMVFYPKGEKTSLRELNNYLVYDTYAHTSYNVKKSYLFPISGVTSDGKFLSVVHAVNAVESEITQVLPDIEMFVRDNGISEDSNPILVVWDLP